MPWPLLIPILLGGAAITAGGVGAVAAADAISTNKEANKIFENAEYVAKKAEEEQNKVQKELEESAQKLGEVKRDIYAGNMKLCFDLIDGLSAEGACGVELARLSKEKRYGSTRDNTSTVIGVLSSGVGGLGLSALGIGGVVLFGSASTGTALGSLSGAAFTSAFTAWFGGGAAAAGGLGMAVGGSVLLGVIAAPALLFGGIAASLKADEKLSKAKGDLAKAETFAEQVRASTSFKKGIIEKAEMMKDLLCRIDSRYFAPLLKRAESVRCGRYDKQSKVVQDLFCTCVKVSETLDDIMNIPLLTKDGKLAPELESFSPDKTIAEISSKADPFFVPGVL